MSLFESQAPRPLADRLRPERLEDVVGQDHLLGPEGPIGRMLAKGRLASMILWGPPGCGKTTIARLLSEKAGLEFMPLSAVFSGVADLKKAKGFKGATGTISIDPKTGNRKVVPVYILEVDSSGDFVITS